ncbi:hypothetical protein QR680_001534 [Steinernema hermaphroditum]|uniref:Uncharacterized protein n=1 Tax=Steinernema hermaphroditum TaxID=289476 RepID=A0AA39GZH7_9BILA|nr:hypothetical protein QR680_001534 [Steinernema hermaphroditum]
MFTTSSLSTRGCAHQWQPLTTVEALNRIILEIWKFSNLLQPSVTNAPFDAKEDRRFILRYKKDQLALASGYALFTKINGGRKDEQRFHTFVNLIIDINIKEDGSLLIAFDNGELMVNDSGSVTAQSITRIPHSLSRPVKTTLLANDNVLSISDKGDIYICFNHSPRYSYLDERSELADLQLMELIGGNFAIFDLRLQKLFVFQWSSVAPFYITAMHEFKEECTTVDCCARGDVLYSLTQDGLISEWNLISSRRMIRKALYRTSLPNCLQILIADDKRFVIHTATKLAFLVV